MSEDTTETINEAISLLTTEKELREKFLRSLNELQKTRLSLIEHEIKTIRNEDENDPKLEMLEENVEGGKQVLKIISNQLEIGTIEVPRVKEGEVIVHGRITDENGKGKANCEISLVADGEPINIFGKSDKSGYYSIVLPVPIVKKMEGKDFDIYVRRNGSLIDKSSHMIKFTGREFKYEAVVYEDMSKMEQPADKKKERTTRKRK